MAAKQQLSPANPPVLANRLEPDRFRTSHSKFITEMQANAVSILSLLLGLVLLGQAADQAPQPQPDPARQLRAYRDFAMGRDGNPERGRQLFNDEQRAACAKCHSIDGTSSKAGPDLLAVGDKFPRRELIQAILEPSAVIAVGYGTTIVETKAGEEFQGIIKSSPDGGLDLMGADGKHILISKADIKEQRGTAVSLMPEGLHAGMSQQEFADLVEYLVTLKQPESALTGNRGMPSTIPELAKPVTLRPFFSELMRFPHAFVQKPGDIRSGLVWFGQVPGSPNTFLAGHQTGKLWLLEKVGTNETKTLFADISKDIFNERGPNGLLGVAFHPKFRENRRYFVKHQVFEGGKIETTVAERVAAADLRSDSGQPERRLWSVASTTQDHSGGCIGFGWWEKESDYQAVVWDLNTAKTAGSVTTNVTGTSALVGVIVPLPFIARVQGTACDRLAGQLGSFLRGSDPSVTPAGT